jgi:uncharacterized phage protein gp47/JayE
MIEYGITDTGFILKRFEVCLNELMNVIRELFGEDVNLDAESVHGQLVHVLALREADLWERMQAAYNATRPSSAVGVTLDDILALRGLVRLPETKSQVSVSMLGPDTTVVPVGFSISDEDETKFFELAEETEILASNAFGVIVEITAAAAGTYTINIDGTDYSFVATTETVDEIIDGLTAVLTAALGDAITIIKDYDLDVMSIYSTDLETHRVYTVTGNLSIGSVSTIGTFYCIETGPVSAPVDTLTKITTPGDVVGVTNLTAASPGRLVESDMEARVRLQRSFAGINGATQFSIENRILSEVNNVSWCRVFSNNTDLVDEAGRPPHSIEVVALGGINQDIFDKIFECKAGGIQTYGNQAGTVEDIHGNIYDVYFSRPVDAYVWARCTIVYDYEIAYPVDGDTQIKNSLVEYGNLNFSLGRDLVNDRLKTPVHQVSGIRSVSIELAITDTPGGTPSYGAPGDDVIITPIQQPVFDASRIIILES